MERYWIKLWRKSMDSQAFQNEGLWKVWTWCLMKANHAEAWFPLETGRGTTEVHLRPGQFVFGRKVAARELRMPESTVWGRMRKLERMQNIEIKSDSHYSIVTIRNWEKYQSGKNELRQATDTNNNDKNKKKDITQKAESIYGTYPRKAARQNSIKSIVKLLKAGTSQDALLKAVNNYKAYIKRNGTERDYIVQSNNFFGQAARWKEWCDGGTPKAHGVEPVGRAYQPFEEELCVNSE